MVNLRRVLASPARNTSRGAAPAKPSGRIRPGLELRPRRSVSTPLRMGAQRGEGISRVVVAAQGHIRIDAVQFRHALVARIIQARGWTNQQRLDVHLRGRIQDVGQVQPAARGGHVQVDVAVGQRDDQAVFVLVAEAARGFAQPAFGQGLGSFGGEASTKETCRRRAGSWVRAMTRPNQPNPRGSPCPASSSSPIAVMRIVRNSNWATFRWLQNDESIPTLAVIATATGEVAIG